MFEDLIVDYTIFDRIWDFVLPFGFKTRESDIGHAPFRLRQCEPLLSKSSLRLGSFGMAHSCFIMQILSVLECAYGFRYVELNHRTEGSKDNPDYDPWSVRQTTVYQQYSSTLDRVTFVLIAPSSKGRKCLEMALKRSIGDQRPINAFDLHRIIISTLHENWRHYIRSLEKLLMIQVSPALSELLN